MNKKEKEKQKVINELFHTELTHVRHLQVLEELFSVPMRNEHIMSKEDLDTLFPNLSEVRRMLRTYWVLYRKITLITVAVLILV